jgi:hypothetical protein
VNWILFWKIVLILTLAGYSLLVIIVISGGIKNIIDMLKDLKSESPQP